MPAEREGFWFDAPDASLCLNRSGHQVSLAQAVPPWMVVEQSVAGITIGSRWPGRLWRVRVTQLGDMSGLVAQPGYWRAAAIELLEELPVSTLFGPQGGPVVSLLERIRNLSRPQAEQLAAGVPPQAWRAWGRAWVRWSADDGAAPSGYTSDADTSSGSPSGAAPETDGALQAWDGVLSATRRLDKQRSPIHAGFLLIHTLVRERAQSLDGDAAFELIEDDGEIEQWLAPMWRDVSDACLYAAMALGGAQWVAHGQAAVLTQAWRGVFGDSVDAPATAG